MHCPVVLSVKFIGKPPTVISRDAGLPSFPC